MKVAKDLSCFGLGDLDEIIASTLGTEVAVFKTQAEMSLPVELEEGVAVRWWSNG